MASSSSSPCAACKFLRRKCTPECVFAPYFPPDTPQKFANVHKVFGASNVSKILNELHPTNREQAVNSLAYEAEARLTDPVYGCVGVISILQHQIKHIHAELHTARTELARCLALAGIPAAPQTALQNNPFYIQQQQQQQFLQQHGSSTSHGGGVVPAGYYAVTPMRVEQYLEQQQRQQQQQIAAMVAADREQREVLRVTGYDHQGDQVDRFCANRPLALEQASGSGTVVGSTSSGSMGFNGLVLASASPSPSRSPVAASGFLSHFQQHQGGEGSSNGGGGGGIVAASHHGLEDRKPSMSGGGGGILPSST